MLMHLLREKGLKYQSDQHMLKGTCNQKNQVQNKTDKGSHSLLLTGKYKRFTKYLISTLYYTKIEH